MAESKSDAETAGSGAFRRSELFLELPGFPPDTVGFALRTTLAVLLAYYLAFRMQLPTASSAGLCVAIVVQPGHGATVSKSVYRITGTVIGGVVAVAALAIFPQDRTMLLAIFVVWMGICTFVASMLRDFGAYGAALAGYTFGIVALVNLDTPDATFLAALNRVAAILLAIACAGLVNGILSRPTAFRALASNLQQAIDRTTGSVVAALRGDASPVTGIAAAEQASSILALRTQASNVAAESQDGGFRAAGARSSIVALLGMMSLARLIVLALERHAPNIETTLAIDSAATILNNPATDMPSPVSIPSSSMDMQQTFLQICTSLILERQVLALDGLAALRTGSRPARQVRLKLHNDVTGAVLNGMRAAIATTLAVLFCIYGGWSGATLMLIQISAYAALLGRLPQPTRAALLLGIMAPFPIFFAWIVQFLLLPQGSSFLLFVLALAPFIILASVASRHPRLSPAGNVMLVVFLLTLTPSNPENYNPITFFNTAACLIGSIIAVLSGFVLILPVSPSRRLFRLFQAVVDSLRETLPGGRPYDLPAVLTLQFDRLANVLPWLGRHTPARLALTSQLGDLVALDAALCRAHAVLDTIEAEDRPLEAVVAQARTALRRPTPAGIADAMARLLAAPSSGPTRSPPLIRAAASLYAVLLLLDEQSRLLKRLDLTGPA